MSNFGEPLVFLVGAGPGDPGLLTLRGAEVLKTADVILYDGLCNPDLLAHASSSAQQICVGKHGQARIWRQDEINAEIVRHASLGRKVVRLKGGDPAVFARTAEEVEAVTNAGLAFEIVPGITAALAAGSYAGIPITHRGIASAVALVTGHEEPDKPESALDWDALARFPGTLVVYMGVTTVESWTSALLQAGKRPDTPSAILRRCSLPDQQTLLCRLDEVADRLTPAHRFRPPVIVIIGAVAQLHSTMSWFDRRPLFGQRILVTRPEDQADELTHPLRRLGADVLQQPAITIRATSHPEPLDHALNQLSDFDLIAFSSRNGVRYFCERLLANGADLRSLAHLRIAAVGAKTAERLAEFHLRADIIPADFRATALLEMLAPFASGLRILLPKASRGSTTLADGLRGLGASVHEVVCYDHRDVEQPEPANLLAMQQARIAWTTVTSNAIAHSLVALFGSSLQQTQLVSLSPQISRTLTELGFPPAAEATNATMESMLEAIVLASVPTNPNQSNDHSSSMSE
jgi:uroporphyrinogen III methyltransferase/synthase